MGASWVVAGYSNTARKAGAGMHGAGLCPPSRLHHIIQPIICSTSSNLLLRADHPTCCVFPVWFCDTPADAKAQTLHAFLGVSQQHQPLQPAAAVEQQQQVQQQQQQQQDEAAAMEEDRPVQHDGLAPPAGAAAAAAAAAAAIPAARRRAGPAAAAGNGGAFAFMPTPMEIAGAGAVSARTAGASQPPAASQQQQGTQFVAPVRHQRATGPNSSLASVQALLAEAESRPHAGGWLAIADLGGKLRLDAPMLPSMARNTSAWLHVCVPATLLRLSPQGSRRSWVGQPM